ncbi:hypothetical protein CJF30_00011376 [Rutstroemia sp. NJR-2017a BBW]|nr:hypothetical protein CJF30_00011376 [Rutstroemia sp. NJR-2017a BBW]
MSMWARVGNPKTRSTTLQAAGKFRETVSIAEGF